MSRRGWAVVMVPLALACVTACEGAKTLPPCPAGTERAASGDCVVVVRDAALDGTASAVDAGPDATIDAGMPAPDAGEIDAAGDLDAPVDAGGGERDVGVPDAGPDLGCRCACTVSATSTIGAATAEVSSPRVAARTGGVAFAWRAEADGHVHLGLGDVDATSVDDVDLGALGLEPSLVVTADGLALSTRGGTGASIATQAFDAAAMPSGAAGVVATRFAEMPQLRARDDGGLMLAWLGDGAAHLATLDAAGSEIGRAHVADIDDAAPEIGAARGADRTLVAWSEEAAVWTAVVEDAGRVGGAVALTDGAALGRIRAVSAARFDAGFVVAWSTDAVDPLDVFSDEGERIMVARLGLDGRPAGVPVEVARTTDPDIVWPTVAVAASDRGVVVAWGDGLDVALARFSTDLVPWGAPVRTTAPDEVDELSVASVDGGFAAVWSAGPTGVGFARFDCPE